MTEQDIDKLSHQAAKEKLKQFYSDEYKAEMYLALTEKMKMITTSLDNIEKIDLTNKENKQIIDLITDLAEKGSKMADSLDKIREGLDKEILQKTKQERKKSKPISIEALVLNP